MRRALSIVAFTILGASAVFGAPQTQPSGKAAAPAAHAWTKEPSGYRGAEWGTDLAKTAEVVGLLMGRCICSDADLTSFSCPKEVKADDVPDRRSCRSALDVAGTEVEDMLQFENDRLASTYMTFAADDFDKMRDIFVEKYGPPDSTSDAQVHNRMGAAFTNTSLEWHGPRVTITLERYGSDLTKASATIGLNTFRDHLAEAMKKRTKAGADAF
jgi:hypothetical protein